MKPAISPTDFQEVFYAMPVFSLIVVPDSPEFTIAGATDALLQLTKLDKEGVIGKKLFEVFPGSLLFDREKIKALLEIVMEAKLPSSLEALKYDSKSTEGKFRERFWITSASPVLDNSGKVIYIVITSEEVTEKILNEKEKKATNENFRYYLDHISAPFAILIGEDFMFEFANPAYRELMNGRALVGKTLDDAIPELKGQPFIQLLRQVYETGVPFHASEIPATALFDGQQEPTTRYFNLSYTPYKDPDGTTKGIVASGYDITDEVELKKQHAKQVLNQQAYNLFMQAPVGFTLLRGENHLVELVNSTSLKFTGKTEDVVGKPVSEILPEINAQGYLQLLDTVKETGKAVYLKESPVELVRNDVLQNMYLNMFFQPFYEDDTITGILTIMTDVTEQVLSRKKVEELKERFETMANNIPNLAWIADAEGWIFWYNERWYEYTGTTPQEMEGWGWQSVHDPENLPAVLDVWKQSIQDGKPFEMVFPIRGADGVFRPFLTRIIPIRDSDKNIVRWLGTNTDITRQKEIERMKDDFIAMASHELKTPLTTIKAYSQIAESMLEKNGDLETLGMINRMTSQVNKLANLIEELLDVTKLQKGKLIYKEDFFDFTNLLAEVIDDMQKTTRTHEIKVDLGESSNIYGDRNKVMQVIENLLSNALKYSPGADSVIVTSEVSDDGVLLSIQDFGIGILAKNRQKIFSQFYRVEDNSQITFPGMGIGLYICTEIIGRHNGKIWVDSKIRKGSTFHVWLPIDHRVNVAEGAEESV